MSEYEEILGYHLEQSYRYHTELGPANDEIQEVGKRAASHLAEAGRRALRAETSVRRQACSDARRRCSQRASPTGRRSSCSSVTR